MKNIYKNWEFYLFGLIMVYFFYRLIDQALTLAPYIPPDESYHLLMIELLSTKLGMVYDYEIGLYNILKPPEYVTYLYHFIMSKLLWLNIFNLANYQFLRLLNIPISLMTVYFSWKTAKLIFNDKFIALFIVIILVRSWSNFLVYYSYF